MQSIHKKSRRKRWNICPKLANAPEDGINPAIDAILQREYCGDELARDLFARFLQSSFYDRHLVDKLIEVAAGSRGASWDIRCAAILMLECQFLRLDARDQQESEGFLAVLGIRNPRISLTLRSRLKRLERVHGGLRGPGTNAEALLDFIHVSRQECKVFFARYLFTAEEVTTRILSLMRISSGIPYVDANGRRVVDSAGEVFDCLPEFERAIGRALTAGTTVFWTGPKVSSEINSLVEYPISTVVLVVKPPGSDLEFEIKRAGLRGPHPLSALYSREETPVPWCHRLQGGSTGRMLDGEAKATAMVHQIYEAIHGCPAPVSQVLAVSAINTVPAWSGEEQLIPYFSQREAYGEGFESMRAAMAECVEAFEKEDKTSLDLPGDVGLTVNFLRSLAPRQAILVGTSSFRLDAVAKYLSPEGPQAYFGALEGTFGPQDARRFADDLLDEVLGVYVPPKGSFTDYQTYVQSAFTVPVNRSRADRVYLSLLAQIGRFWGTLLAVGAHSHGESFVSRNTGLKSIFSAGRWRVRICFLDHDGLLVPGDLCGEFDPQKAVYGMRIDERHILPGDYAIDDPRVAVGRLQEIYRVSGQIVPAGTQRFHHTLGNAYRKTRRAMNHSRNFRRMFDPEYLRTRSDWDEVVDARLRALQCGVSFDVWASDMSARLAARGYDEDKAKRFVHTAEDAREFLAGYAFAFQGTSVSASSTTSLNQVSRRGLAAKAAISSR